VVQKVEEYTVCNWDLPDEARVKSERAAVRFAVGSTEYVIDECEKHAGDAMKLLTQLTAIADRVDGRPRRHTSRKAAEGSGSSYRPVSHRVQTQEVRRWVQKRFPQRNVSDRGRIPGDLVEEYNRAHK
jgi:nucleoid-associated protein Lsr2